MNRSRTWWLLAAAQCVLLALCPIPAFAQDVSGLTFDVTITTGDSAAATVQSGSGWIAGKSSRLDLRGPANVAQAMPGMPGQNMSIIVRDSSGAPVMAMVDHDAKKVMYPAKMTAMLQEMMASLPERPKVGFSVTNIVVDTLGAGETISGFATKRFRLSADLSVSMEMMGESMDQTIHVVSEGDYAEELAGYIDPLQTTRSLEAMTSGMPGMDSSAVAELGKLAAARPRGLPLRQSDQMTGASEGGMPMPATVTALSNIKRAEFSLTVFSIPDGYTEMEMPQIPGLN